jgi:uncharacterized membrane protein
VPQAKGTRRAVLSQRLYFCKPSTTCQANKAYFLDIFAHVFDFGGVISGSRLGLCIVARQGRKTHLFLMFLVLEENMVANIGQSVSMTF